MADRPTKKRTDEPSRPGPAQWKPWLLGCALAIGAMLLFVPTLDYGYVVWDDNAYIQANPLLRSGEGLRKIWFSTETEQYYPLTFTSYWIEYQCVETDPGLYHATNVVLHGICTLLVLLLARAFGLGRVVSGLVTALFAVHPLQVMTVAWLAQRKNLLAMVFVSLALLAWMSFRRKEHRRYYVFAILAFAGALTSKTAVMLLPLVLVALDRLVLDVPWRRSLVASIPFVLMSIGISIITVMLETRFVDEVPALPERILAAGASVPFYLWKLLWPADLLPIYPFWDVDSGSVVWWIPTILIAALTAVLFWFRKRIDGRVLFGLLFFPLLIGPSTGIIPHGNILITWVSDHYVYTPWVGFLLAGAVLLSRWVHSSPTRGAVLAGVMGLAVLLLAVRSTKHMPVFEDDVAFWGRTLEGNETCYAALIWRGRRARNAGRFPEARADFERAIAVRPRTAGGHQWLATVHEQTGNLMAADAAWKQVCELTPENGNAWIKRGTIAETHGQRDQALRFFERGVDLDECDDLLRFHAHYRLGYRAMQDDRRDFQAAMRHFRGAMRVLPQDPRCRVGLSIALRETGRTAEAVQELEEILTFLPNDKVALKMLAGYWATSPEAAIRDGRRAVEVAERVVRITQRLEVESLDLLCLALAEAGRFDEAIEVAQEAAKLTKDPASMKILEQRVALFRQKKPHREPRLAPHLQRK